MDEFVALHSKWRDYFSGICPITQSQDEFVALHSKWRLSFASMCPSTQSVDEFVALHSKWRLSFARMCPKTEQKLKSDDQLLGTSEAIASLLDCDSKCANIRWNYEEHFQYLL